MIRDFIIEIFKLNLKFVVFLMNEKMWWQNRDADTQGTDVPVFSRVPVFSLVDK